MAVTPETTPVGDTVAKINNELAVGSDLEFQRRWGRIELVTWSILFIFLLLSFAGAFGRGPLANATASASDGSISVRYERIQRFNTPSVLTIIVAAAAVHQDEVQLWTSDALVMPLGNQRVIPAPIKSKIGGGGILYTFPASSNPALTVEFQSQPSSLGLTKVRFRVPGKSMLELAVFVVP